MKDLEDLFFDESVSYSKEHTWARAEGDTVTIGISDYAQNQLGEIIYIELPEIGLPFVQGQVFGFVESVKAASDLHMPVSGTVTDVNQELAESPELANRHPYDTGWMIRINATEKGQLEQLHSASDYLKTLK